MPYTDSKEPVPFAKSALGKKKQNRENSSTKLEKRS